MHPSDDEPLSAQQPPGRWHVDIGAWMASASQADKDALAIEVPGWAGADDLRRLFDHRSDLLLRGDVVWGSVVQANNNLLDPKAPLYFAGAPGEVVYDPQGGVAPEVLDEVARGVYACKGQIFDDEARAFIARYLADERTRVFGLDVPPSLAPCPLKVSTTWFETRGLPLRFMALRHLPLLVSDEHPGLVLPIPARFWPTPFTTAWLASGERMAAATTGKPSYVPPPELAHLSP